MQNYRDNIEHTVGMDQLDEVPLKVTSFSVLGGVNSDALGERISLDQMADASNVSIYRYKDKRCRRFGRTAKNDDVGDNAVNGLIWCDPQSGSDQLVMESNGVVYKVGDLSSNWSSSKTGLSAQSVANFVHGYDDSSGSLQHYLYRLSATDNMYRYDFGSTWTEISSGGGYANAPPPCPIGIWFLESLFLTGNTTAGQRDFIWVSDVGDAVECPMSPIKVGAGGNNVNTCLVGTRQQEIIVGQRTAIYKVLAPLSAGRTGTPTPTDLSVKIVNPQRGIWAGNTAKGYGDEIFALSRDGVVAFVTTVEDYTKNTVIISEPIKSYIDGINWTYAHLATAEMFNRQYFLAIPYGASTYNNLILVYSPELDPNREGRGWSIYGTTDSPYPISCMTTAYFSATGQLIGGDATANTRSYLMEDTSELQDLGANAIEYSEETKAIDFQYPEVEKKGNYLEVTVDTKDAGYLRVLYRTESSSGYTELFLSEIDDSDASGNDQYRLYLADLGGVTPPVTPPVTPGFQTRKIGRYDLSLINPFRTIQFKFYNNEIDVELEIVGWIATAYLNNSNAINV